MRRPAKRGHHTPTMKPFGGIRIAWERPRSGQGLFGHHGHAARSHPGLDVSPGMRSAEAPAERPDRRMNLQQGRSNPKSSRIPCIVATRRSCADNTGKWIWLPEAYQAVSFAKEKAAVASGQSLGGTNLRLGTDQTWEEVSQKGINPGAGTEQLWFVIGPMDFSHIAPGATS